MEAGGVDDAVDDPLNTDPGDEFDWPVLDGVLRVGAEPTAFGSCSLGLPPIIWSVAGRRMIHVARVSR